MVPIFWAHCRGSFCAHARVFHVAEDEDIMLRHLVNEDEGDSATISGDPTSDLLQKALAQRDVPFPLLPPPSPGVSRNAPVDVGRTNGTPP